MTNNMESRVKIIGKPVQSDKGYKSEMKFLRGNNREMYAGSGLEIGVKYTT